MIEVAQSLRATMLTIPALTAIVGDKIFWEHVEDVIEQPYVTMHHYTGGKYPWAEYVDTVWRVAGHTKDLEQAETLYSAILKLDGMNLVTPATVCQTAPLYEVRPYFDRYTVQNVPFFIVGGLYRVQLQLGVI